MEDRKIVKFIRGSRAYGTQNENSDLDTTTIFLEDIYTKATLFPKYRFDDRSFVADDSIYELGRVVERIIACDSAYMEYAYRDLVMEETQYTSLYFDLMDDLIRENVFEEKFVGSRANKHFGDECKRMTKLLGFSNIKNTQKILYQNIRIEKMVYSILEGHPILKFEGKALEELKHYKYGNFTMEELQDEIAKFHGRWVKYQKIPPLEKRDKKFDDMYIEYLRKFDRL